jgi:hypothetical protein
MTDNVTLNSGTGGDVIAADDIGGVKYQRVKATFGADGTATDVSAANALPTTPYGSSDYSGVPLLEPIINGDLAVHAKLINPEARDINGAQIPSDSPSVQYIYASVVGQQFLIDTQGYQSIGLTMGTMAATVLGNNDTRGTFAAISAFPAVLGAPVTTAAANTNYVVPSITRFVKLTTTTIGWAVYTLRQVPVPVNYLANAPVNLTQYLNAAASSTNPMHVTPLALAVTNNQTIPAINVVTATAVAATVVKATAGRLTMLTISNGAAAAAFLHLYNAASVTFGTTASAHVYAIPAAVGNYPINLPDGGLFFSTGICYAFTGAAASIDSTVLTTPTLIANLAFI